VTDGYDLRRFQLAQDEGGTYDRASGELRAGRKGTHWMWFVFPQLVGLGSSPIFGPVDAMKLRSSMTLFASAAPDVKVFQKVLDRYFDGERDELTDRLLGANG
jgi:uncharacterized protein (DUF1810 family)